MVLNVKRYAYLTHRESGWTTLTVFRPRKKKDILRVSTDWHMYRNPARAKRPYQQMDPYKLVGQDVEVSGDPRNYWFIIDWDVSGYGLAPY